MLMLHEALEYHSNPKPYLTQQFNAFIARKLRTKFQKHKVDWCTVVSNVRWLVVSTETGYTRCQELKLYEKLPIVDIRVVTKPQKLVLGPIDCKGKTVGIIGKNNYATQLYKLL